MDNKYTRAASYLIGAAAEYLSGRLNTREFLLLAKRYFDTIEGELRVRNPNCPYPLSHHPNCDCKGQGGDR